MPKQLRFLFRFRDLVASTIKSHKDVIATKGECWWGWWKRPSEDRRADVWQVLSGASPDSPIEVGLFDSGSGKVYSAVVIGIIPPEEHAELSQLPEEKDLVPSYYRESPFSRAWMRLKSIDLLDDFFGHYSFAKAPDLPNYRPELLKRFEGKKIVDASELRSMDTTIWEIRPSELADPSQNIILSTPMLPAAVSGEVVRCQSNSILHITDLHFARGEKKRDQHVWRLETETEGTTHTLSAAIHAAVSDKGKKIGGVIVTGDLTFMGSEEEFDEAFKSLFKLLGLLDLGVDNLILIPGNHDIQWATDEKYTPTSKVTSAPTAARKNFERFYERLFQHKASSHLAMGRRWLLPCGITVETAALNSSSLQTGKDFLAGMGRIDEAGFEEIRAGLGWQSPDNGVLEATAALRILAVHHHLAVTDDIEPATGYAQGYGMAVDAVRIQRLAAKHRVQLALHGHKHRAFLWRSSVYELPEHASQNYRLGEISIVGGGSAGSSETESESNYFNVLEFSPAGLDVKMYRSKSKGLFGLIKSFRAPFDRFADGSLKLGDWTVTN